MDWKQYKRACPLCGNELNQNIIFISKNVVYKCSKCEYKETKPKIFICSQCNQGMLVFQEHHVGLNKRRDIETDWYVYKCDACGRLKSYESDLMMME